MKSSSFATVLVLSVAVLAASLTAAVVWGGPKAPQPLASINNPFKSVDFSDMPPLFRFTAKDGAALGYRYYVPNGASARGSVVLIHGSSASSNSMHVLAKAYARAGYAAYAIDMRGHGSSGAKGKISYVGQLEDDLHSFTQAVSMAKPATLAGFSSGGGFVLRFAGSGRQNEFQNYLLLSPYLSQDAPNYRPASGGWVDVGIPRVIAISILNFFAIRSFNDMPVISFALTDDAKLFLTSEYSFALAANYQPRRDYETNIRAVSRPCAVLAGKDDEIFYTDKLEATFRKQGKNWPVTILPGIAHIPLTLDSRAVGAAVGAVEAMRATGT